MGWFKELKDVLFGNTSVDHQISRMKYEETDEYKKRMQQEEDERFYKNWALGRFQHEEDKAMEKRHSVSQVMLDLPHVTVSPENIEAHREQYQSYLDSLNPIQQWYSMSEKEFCFYETYKNQFLFSLGHIPQMSPQQGYRIYDEKTARYKDPTKLEEDFTKEFLTKKGDNQ